MPVLHYFPYSRAPPSAENVFFDKQKSDVKSHLIKFELRFIDTDNINLTICEIFEIFRADGSQRFSCFIDQFTEKGTLRGIHGVPGYRNRATTVGRPARCHILGEKNVSTRWPRKPSPLGILEY